MRTKLNRGSILKVGLALALFTGNSYAQPPVWGEQARILKEERLLEKSKLAEPKTRFPLLAEYMLSLTKSRIDRDKASTHAIEVLEQEKIEMVLPLLVQKLDLLSYYMDPREPMADTNKKFVASKALIGFGPIATPYLFDCITTEQKNSVHWLNAIDTAMSITPLNSERARDAFFYQQANRYDENERFLRYLAKDISVLVLQDNLIPNIAKQEKPVLNDEQLRSCFEKSLLIWKSAPKAPVDTPIDQPLPPEPIEVPVAGAPSAKQIEKIILELGDLRCEYAIPALQHRLDFKVTRADESFYYPAVTALSKLDESAVEPLVWQLAQPYQKQIVLQNGVSALVNITGNEAAARESLLKGANEAKRRATYIRDLIKSW